MDNNLSSREQIYGLIEDNPGIHFREIQRRSGMAVGQVEYHLYQLERDEKVVTRPDGKVKRYFCVRSDSYSERQLIFYLRSTNTRDILQRLAKEETVPMDAFLKVRKSRLEKRKQAIENMEKDLIIEVFTERGKKFVRVRNRDALLDAARKYRESFIDSLSDSFISIMDDE